MTYDGTDPNDDGVVEADIDNQSVSTDGLSTNARGPSVVVHVTNGSIVADGPSSRLASGDIMSPGDVTAVVQAAIDNGGAVTLKGPGDSTEQVYTLAKSGNTDADGEPFCLEMRENTTLVVGENARLEYPGSTADGLDLASPILCSDTDNWRIDVLGAVDGGLRAGEQTTDRRDIMTIKVGCRRGDGSTACNDWAINGHHTGTIQGAFRHGIEATDGSTRGFIDNLIFDDASGDDDISISVSASHIKAQHCLSVNKDRDGDWTTHCYEIEDGAEHCAFIDCHAIDPIAGGVQVGKTHRQSNATYGPVTDCWAEGCTVTSPGNNGFNLGGFHQEVERIGLIDCKCWDAGISSVVINAGSATITDPYIRDFEGYNPSQRNIHVRGGAVNNLEITNPTLVGATQAQIEFLQDRAASSADFNFDISGGRIEDGTNFGVRCESTASEYSGTSPITDVKFRNQDFGPFGFVDDTDIRQHVITIDNHHDPNSGGNKDESPVRPANPANGMRMMAAASLRSTSYPGYDYYDGSNSTWREM